MRIGVRYTQDAFSRSGWLWPVDAKCEPLKATSYMAVGFYVAKYVNKKSDMDLAAKGLGAKEWNNSLKTKLSLLPFFFSSRRRHTRSLCDWSSDVCSSDLTSFVLYLDSRSSFEMPKSPKHTLQSSRSMIFALFRSRWMIGGC